LSHPSLQRESIESTLEALAEANEDAREIDGMIRIGGDVALSIDQIDQEVEADLNALLDEVKQEEEDKAALHEQESADIAQLPSPPDGNLLAESRSVQSRIVRSKELVAAP
jgi:charged multivesicular body protein 7